MNKKIIYPTLCFVLILISALYSLKPKGVSAASFVNEGTLILYDAASGTVPEVPLLSFTDFPPGVARPGYSDGVTIMDTSASGSDTYAGWVANGAATPGFPILDRTTGFQVNFTIQVENESHTSNHRAGFNVIILGEDARGIELAFWPDQIWAQGDDGTGGLFRHAEGVAFATNTGLVDYQLAIVDNTYTLTADATPILTGPVRDYSAFDGFPDPYETPSFLFLGDNTTSAQARVRLTFVSITGTQPVLPTETSTGTSTASPEPTASFTPPPSATPLPSPTPAGTVFEACPSGWIVSVVMITGVAMMKKNRAG